MTKPVILNPANTQGHACFFYNTDKERLSVLTEYFKEGIANNELCIFVTPGSPAQAILGFQALGFDASIPYSDHSLRIFETASTYLPAGNFAAGYMLGNVKSFIADAKAQGYSGLRTAGEMSWLKDHAHAIDEAITYEHDVNALGTPDAHFMGLCLYAAEGSDKVLESTLRTHPTFIYDGEVRPNPHYSPA